VPDDDKPRATLPSESTGLSNLGTGYGREVPFRTRHVGGGAHIHDPGPGEPGYSEGLRRAITEAAEQSEEPVPMQSTTETPPGTSSAHGGIDGAVLALSELLALLFGLPFGDDLYHDRPIPGLHWLYLGIAIFCAIGGPMWPTIRKRWASPDISTSIAKAARDARIWIALLFVFFLYGVAPEIYKRATAPIPPPVVTGFTQQQVDKKVAEAVQNALHPPPPPAPPPKLKPHYSAEEIGIMQTALRAMYTALTTTCKPAADANWRLLSIWESQPASVNGDPRAFAYQLITDRDSVSLCASQLRHIVDSNGLYASELNETMPNDQAASLVGLLDIVIRDLDELGKIQGAIDARNILIEQWKQWSATSKVYNVWVGETTNRVTSKIDELRNWRND
jgi:hypothetical protein